MSAVQNIIKADRNADKRAAEKEYSSTVNRKGSRGRDDDTGGEVLKDFFSKMRDKSPVNIGFQAVRTSL